VSQTLLTTNPQDSAGARMPWLADFQVGLPVLIRLNFLSAAAMKTSFVA
jgi:hypothetical protein